MNAEFYMVIGKPKPLEKRYTMAVNDTVVGRIGTLIELRKKNIRYFEKMLRNNNLAEITRRQIEKELESEKSCLLDAMDLDSVLELIDNEFKEIKEQYCK